MPMLARSAIRGCEASEVKGEPNIMRADIDSVAVIFRAIFTTLV